MIGSLSGPWRSGGLHGKLLISLVTPALMMWLHGYSSKLCVGGMETNAGYTSTVRRVMVVSGIPMPLSRGNRKPSKMTDNCTYCRR